MAFYAVRTFLYLWFFAFSVILMALTAYRVRYTKRLDHPDVLTTRQHFYNPIVVELLVTGIFGTIWSIWMLFILLCGLGHGPLASYITEYVALCLLFVMSLIGASIFTSQFGNLTWCRSDKVCRILETIEAFSWIFWGWTLFLVFASLLNMWRNHQGFSSPVHGRADGDGTRPEVRSTGTQPVTTSGAPAAVDPEQPVHA